jgi:glycosyltransferase involved in cell wall biosynthesis
MSAAISVVVPVYNAEKYLKECVDSLLSQTFRDVEFIFVDDGSTDRSVEILEEYQKKDGRIQILQQQNQYAGVARNNGMKAATGKYIIFLDADDFFAPTMLEDAYRCGEANDAQIVVFSFCYYITSTKQSTPRAKSNLPKSVFCVSQCSNTFFSDMYAAPWNKLFLKSFVDENRIEFKPIRKFNDNYFVLMNSCLASRIVFLDKPLVNYRVNNSESLQGNLMSGRELFLDALAPVKQDLISLGLYVDIVKEALSRFACVSINHLWSISEKTEESLSPFYNTVKSRMIPEIFESPNDFSSDPLTSDLYDSSNFVDFVLRRMSYEEKKATDLSQKVKELYETTVSKSSITFKLGNAILFLPRAILRLLRH